jgi:hypothetical protein
VKYESDFTKRKEILDGAVAEVRAVNGDRYADGFRACVQLFDRAKLFVYLIRTMRKEGGPLANAPAECARISKTFDDVMLQVLELVSVSCGSEDAAREMAEAALEVSTQMNRVREEAILRESKARSPGISQEIQDMLEALSRPQ